MWKPGQLVTLDSVVYRVKRPTFMELRELIIEINQGKHTYHRVEDDELPLLPRDCVMIEVYSKSPLKTG